MKRKNLVILGATGSIGDSTLKVVRGNPERLNVVGIAGKKNYEKLAKIADEFNVGHVAIFDGAAFDDAKASGSSKTANSTAAKRAWKKYRCCPKPTRWSPPSSGRRR